MSKRFLTVILIVVLTAFGLATAAGSLGRDEEPAPTAAKSSDGAVRVLGEEIELCAPEGLHCIKVPYSGRALDGADASAPIEDLCATRGFCAKDPDQGPVAFHVDEQGNVVCGDSNDDSDVVGAPLAGFYAESIERINAERSGSGDRRPFDAATECERLLRPAMSDSVGRPSGG